MVVTLGHTKLDPRHTSLQTNAKTLGCQQCIAPMHAAQKNAIPANSSKGANDEFRRLTPTRQSPVVDTEHPMLRGCHYPMDPNDK